MNSQFSKKLQMVKSYMKKKKNQRSILAINENTFQNNIEIPSHLSQKDTLKKDNDSTEWTQWVYKDHIKLEGNVVGELE